MDAPIKRNNRNKQKGFSLVEILIAVTIVVLMGGVVAYNVFPELFRSQRGKAELDIGVIKQAVKMFRLSEARLPNQSEFPTFLFDGSKKHPEPYIDPDSFGGSRELLDPWGNPYQYKKLSSKDYEILSYGLDGQPGGEGDDADISSKKSNS